MLLAVLLLSGCAGKGGFNDFRVSIGLISPYKAAEEAFKKGDMIEARQRLESIKKTDKDYAKARRFLNNKVDPARLKLLRYYARKGKSEEAAGHWAQAEEAYKTAAALSRSPKALLRYQKAMNIKARQLRMQSLYIQRLQEDNAWLEWLDNYTPPRGLLGDDVAFALARDDLAEVLEYRLDHALWLANKHKKLGFPEIAWVYADSYLRFKPDSKKAMSLKQAMQKIMPKALSIEEIDEKIVSNKIKKVYPINQIKPTHKKVTKKDVQLLMKAKKWAEAKREALMLRRQGNPDADALLKIIEQKTSALAASAYEQGNIAFRKEHIEQAVSFWEKAVQWMPDEQLYVDTLRRGRKVQERLAALKRVESPAEKDSKIEE
jgi:tetratricopeptide (TPR) repeat protein